MSNLRCDLTCDFTKFLGVCSSIFFCLVEWKNRWIIYYLVCVAWYLEWYKKIKWPEFSTFYMKEYWIGILTPSKVRICGCGEKFVWSTLIFCHILTKNKVAFFPFFISCYFFIFIPNVCPSLCQNNPGHSLGMKIIY